MRTRTYSSIVKLVGALIASTGLLLSSSSAAGNYQVIYAFTGGDDGGNPATPLIFDSSGNAYGTTVVGGTYTYGTVFELTPSSQGQWKETPLYSFSGGPDGKAPHGGVTLHGGNLYGTTVAGGSGFCSSDGCGVVFSLTPHGLNVVYSFRGGNDGFGPGGGVVFDANGNMYGTTPDGGKHSAGVVYELSPNGKHWQFRVIHAFTGGRDGAVGSLGLLLVDNAGNLYGVAELGGAGSAGTVYRLSPDSSGAWTFTTLYAFAGSPDAGFPYGGLIADAAGNLYGTTYYGGANNLGSVFELRLNGKGKYSERVLYSFKGGSDGSSPTSTLTFDKGGTLWGTTSAGGGAACDCGTIFKLNPRSRIETVTHRFGGSTSDGKNPYYGLAPDATGRLYGAATSGGADSSGVVFDFAP